MTTATTLRRKTLTTTRTDAASAEHAHDHTSSRGTTKTGKQSWRNAESGTENVAPNATRSRRDNVMNTKEYELRLADNRRVVWTGKDGEDASRNYVASHPTATVIAWRTYPRHGLFIGIDPRRVIG